MRTARTAAPAARRPRRTGRTSVVLIAAGTLALAGCSGADDDAPDAASSAAAASPSTSASAGASAAPTDPAPTDPVDGTSEAAQAVADSLAAARDAGTGAFDFSSQTDAGGQTVVATGEGTFDTGSQALDLRLSSQLPGQGEVALELRQVDGTAYVSGLPGQPADQWVSVSLEELGAAGGPLGGADPSQQLSLLEQAGDVEEVGAEDVDGAATTHYRGEVDLEAAAEGAQQEGADLDQLRQQYQQLGLSTIPFDLYVGQDGLPVRTATTVETSADSQQVSSQSTVDFSDWGTDVAVEAPQGAVPLSELQASAAPATPAG
ncbi:hypothetical protein WDZ17_01165 [Pseudokineococcus basanitobsidens]|uniref:LppX_LprAFG lipoprotein n=1 Tax=Pseudokineococcus basanitobsidens TaxID=1926649 RepID=A0ABU8RFP6_9ACTN